MILKTARVSHALLRTDSVRGLAAGHVTVALRGV